MVKNVTLVLLLFIIGFVAKVESQDIDDDDDYIWLRVARCNTEQLSPHDPSLAAIQQAVVYNVTYQAPSTGPHYGYYTSQQAGQGGTATAYGYGCCDADQSADGCCDCLSVCRELFYEKCGNAVGAQINMTVCFMRYENYPFM